MNARALLINTLAAAILATTAGARTAPSPQPRPTIPDCGAQAYQPADLTLACGDGNYGLTGMKWTDWDSDSVPGRGFARANDCTPNCAAGHFHTYPVRATASRLRTCTGGLPQYTRLVLDFLGKRPPGIGAIDRWTFRCDAPGPGPTLTAEPLGGMRVRLVGRGWGRLSGCGGEVALASFDRGDTTPFATRDPGKDSSFHIVWTAPRTGKLALVAIERCSGTQSRYFLRAVAVTVR